MNGRIKILGVTSQTVPLFYQLNLMDWKYSDFRLFDKQPACDNIEHRKYSLAHISDPAWCHGVKGVK